MGKRSSCASQSPGIWYKICKQLEIYKFNGFTTNLLSPTFVKVLIIDSCTSKSQRSTLPFLSPSFTFTWDVRSLFNQVPFGRKLLGTSHPTVHHFSHHPVAWLTSSTTSPSTDNIASIISSFPSKRTLLIPAKRIFSLTKKNGKKSSRILLGVVTISKSIALPSPNQITPPFTESSL